jgi:hypothetical protein
MASVLSSPLPARRRLIRVVMLLGTHPMKWKLLILSLVLCASALVWYKQVFRWPLPPSGIPQMLLAACAAIASILSARLFFRTRGAARLLVVLPILSAGAVLLSLWLIWDAPGAHARSISLAGSPIYQRSGKGWSFECWIYPDSCWNYQGSRVFHGRLRNEDGEVFGKKDGETIETSFGSLVWRGDFSLSKVPERSTGWLFIDSYSGPEYILDSYEDNLWVFLFR